MRKLTKIHSTVIDNNRCQRNTIRCGSITLCLGLIMVFSAIPLLYPYRIKPSSQSEIPSEIPQGEVNFLLLFILGLIIAGIGTCIIGFIRDTSETNPRCCPQLISRGIFKLCQKEPSNPAEEGYSSVSQDL